MDPLERLSAEGVPPVPDAARVRAGVRRKLHPRLLAKQLLEFAIWGMLWAVFHLAGALVAAIRFTMTGVWPSRPGDSAYRPHRGHASQEPPAGPGVGG